jgi:hypothetical protein
VGLAHGLHGAGVLAAWAASITSASEMNWWVVMPKWARRGFDRPTQIISTSATMGVPPARMRACRPAWPRVEGGQAVELEVGVGVDHPAHQRPLLGGVGVRAGFGVDDGEGVVLDGAAGGGELFGDGVAGGGDGMGFLANQSGV